LSVKEAERFGTGKISQNPRANWEGKQKAAVESSRNCGEDELVLGIHGTECLVPLTALVL
jgi:hypothetical protein